MAERQIDAISIGITANLAGLKASLSEAAAQIRGWQLPDRYVDVQLRIKKGGTGTEGSLPWYRKQISTAFNSVEIHPSTTSINTIKSNLKKALGEQTIDIVVDPKSAEAIKTSIQEIVGDKPYMITLNWRWGEGPSGPPPGAGGGPGPGGPTGGGGRRGGGKVVPGGPGGVAGPNEPTGEKAVVVPAATLETTGGKAPKTAGAVAGKAPKEPQAKAAGKTTPVPAVTPAPTGKKGKGPVVSKPKTGKVAGVTPMAEPAVAPAPPAAPEPAKAKSLEEIMAILDEIPEETQQEREGRLTTEKIKELRKRGMILRRVPRKSMADIGRGEMPYEVTGIRKGSEFDTNPAALATEMAKIETAMSGGSARIGPVNPPVQGGAKHKSYHEAGFTGAARRLGAPTRKVALTREMIRQRLRAGINFGQQQEAELAAEAEKRSGGTKPAEFAMAQAKLVPYQSVVEGIEANAAARGGQLSEDEMEDIFSLLYGPVDFGTGEEDTEIAALGGQAVTERSLLGMTTTMRLKDPKAFFGLAGGTKRKGISAEKRGIRVSPEKVARYGVVRDLRNRLGALVEASGIAGEKEASKAQRRAELAEYKKVSGMSPADQLTWAAEDMGLTTPESQMAFAKARGSRVRTPKGAENYVKPFLKGRVARALSHAPKTMPKMGLGGKIGKWPRLYRGDTSISGEKGTIPEWLAEHPHVKDSQAAHGRWFTDTPEKAQYYVDEFGEGGEGKITSVAVGPRQYEKYRVSNFPPPKREERDLLSMLEGKAPPPARRGDDPRRFSARPEEEWFLPPRVAARAKPWPKRALGGGISTPSIWTPNISTEATRLRAARSGIKQAFPNANVGLSWVNPELMPYLARTSERFASHFPWSASQLSSLTTEDLQGKYGRGVHGLTRGMPVSRPEMLWRGMEDELPIGSPPPMQIQLDARAHGLSIGDIRRKQRRYVGQGTQPRGTWMDPSFVLWHELGHLVDRSQGLLPESLFEGRPPISKYGATALHENFADVFAQSHIVSAHSPYLPEMHAIEAPETSEHFINFLKMGLQGEHRALGGQTGGAHPRKPGKVRRTSRSRDWSAEPNEITAHGKRLQQLRTPQGVSDVLRAVTDLGHIQLVQEGISPQEASQLQQDVFGDLADESTQRFMVAQVERAKKFLHESDPFGEQEWARPDRIHRTRPRSTKRMRASLQRFSEDAQLGIPEPRYPTEKAAQEDFVQHKGWKIPSDLNFFGRSKSIYPQPEHPWISDYDYSLGMQDVLGYSKKEVEGQVYKEIMGKLGSEPVGGPRGAWMDWQAEDILRSLHESHPQIQTHGIGPRQPGTQFNYTPFTEGEKFSRNALGGPIGKRRLKETFGKPRLARDFVGSTMLGTNFHFTFDFPGYNEIEEARAWDDFTMGIKPTWQNDLWNPRRPNELANDFGGLKYQQKPYRQNALGGSAGRPKHYTKPRSATDKLQIFSAYPEERGTSFLHPFGGNGPACRCPYCTRDRFSQRPQAAQSFFPWSVLPNPKKHALGGESKQKPIIVGEMGSEIFVPESAGWIIPHHLMDQLPKRALGGDVPGNEVPTKQGGYNMEGQQGRLTSSRIAMLGSLSGAAIQRVYVVNWPPSLAGAAWTQAFGGRVVGGQPVEAGMSTDDLAEAIGKAMKGMPVATGGRRGGGRGGRGGGGGGGGTVGGGDEGETPADKGQKPPPMTLIDQLRAERDIEAKYELTSAVPEIRSMLTGQMGKVTPRAFTTSMGEAFGYRFGGREAVLAKTRMAGGMTNLAQTWRKDAENMEKEFIKIQRETFGEGGWEEQLLGGADVQDKIDANVKRMEELRGAIVDTNAAASAFEKEAISLGKSSVGLGTAFRFAASNLTGILGPGMLVMTTSMAAIQLAETAGAKALEPWIDRWTDFSQTTNKVTGGLSDSTRQMNGLVKVSIAAAAAQAGLSDSMTEQMQTALSQRAVNEAGSKAFSDQLGILRAIENVQRPQQGALQPFGGIPGLTRSTGGLFGSPIGAQPSIMEQLSNELTGGVPMEGLTTLGNLAAGGVLGNNIWGNTTNSPGAQFFNKLTAPSPLGMSPLEAFFSGNPLTGPIYSGAKGLGIAPKLTTNPEDIARFGRAVTALNEGATKVKSSFQLVAVSAVTSSKDLQESLKAASKESMIWAGISEETAQKYVDAGYAVADMAGGIARPVNLTGTERWLSAAAEGMGKPTAQQLLTQQGPAIAAQLGAIQAQTQGQLQIFNPAQRYLQYAANRPIQYGTSFMGQQGGQIGGFSTRADISQMTNFGQASQAAGDALKWLDEQATIGRQQLLKMVPASVVQQFEELGKTTQSLRIGVMTQQASLATAQYNHQLYLVNRNLADAEALAGRRGKTEQGLVGYYERQNWLLGRQSQALSIAMSQRQINFQKAIAGFQVQGLTPEEQAARVKQAEIEASWAQKQLDIQKQQYAIGLPLFNVQASRQIKDLQFTLAELNKSRTLQLDTQSLEAAQGLIGQMTEGLSMNINTYIGKFTSEFNLAISVAQQIASQTGQAFSDVYGQVAAAWNSFSTAAVNSLKQIQAQIDAWTIPGYVSSGGGGGGAPTAPKLNASGFVGQVSGATHMVVGEAGPETVAILSNPRTVAAGLGGGGGYGGGGGPAPVTFNITIEGGGGEITDVKLKAWAGDILRQLDRSLGRTAALVGMRDQAFYNRSY